MADVVNSSGLLQDEDSPVLAIADKDPEDQTTITTPLTPTITKVSRFDEVIEVSEDDPNKQEALKLGGRGTLRTILLLMVGPLISQLVSAFYGVIDSMWVSKALGPAGMSAVSMFSNLENIGRAFGFFLSTAASSQISYLFGQGLGEEAAQLIADLIRSAFVCGALVSATLLPAAKPLGRWFGADEELNQAGFKYLCPTVGCSFVSCIYLLLCGCLQAEGRTFVVAGLQICSLLLNMCVFDPLFLLGLKLGTPGASVATIISEALPTLVILTLFFRGKFGVKPKVNMLFKRFSKRTIPAMRVGVSQLFANLSRSIPSIFLRKFMGLCAERMENATFADAAVGFNAVTRIFGITDSLRLASCMSFLPTGSYAFSRQKYRRFMFLALHTGWINLIWGTGTCLFTAFGGKYVAMSISSEESYLKWAAPMLKTSNWEAPMAWVRNICQTSMQAMQLGKRATLYSFLATFVVYIGYATMLYYTNNHNFIRLMYVFPLTSATSLVLGVLWMIKPVMDMYREYKHPDAKNHHESLKPKKTEKESSSCKSTDEKFEDKSVEEEIKDETKEETDSQKDKPEVAQEENDSNHELEALD